MSEDEESLAGDGVTQGIVRIGDTVRRPVRPFSRTIQAYLAHLHQAGFTGAPIPLGIDELGREVLSYVPGDVPRNPLPPQTAGEEVLVALARLIRALHEASAGWTPPPDAVWGGTPASIRRTGHDANELVSHRDYYPGNVVFRDGLPAALIDFGLDIPRRVAVFADAYRMSAEQRSAFAPFVIEMARRYFEDSRDSAELDPVFKRLWENGAKYELPRAEQWLRRIAPDITARLTA